MNGHNRIMIYGPKNNGHVRHRIQNSQWGGVAISVPRGETRAGIVLRRNCCCREPHLPGRRNTRVSLPVRVPCEISPP
jgi:hypothetical protein